jgi:hypothetical protein
VTESPDVTYEQVQREPSRYEIVEERPNVAIYLDRQSNREYRIHRESSNTEFNRSETNGSNTETNKSEINKSKTEAKPTPEVKTTPGHRTATTPESKATPAENLCQ